MLNAIDDLCFWKSIAIKDLAKDYQKTTFNENAKCVSCAGYDKECPEYLEKLELEKKE